MKLIDQHGEISSLQNGIAFYERTSSFVSRVHPEGTECRLES